MKCFLTLALLLATPVAAGAQDFESRDETTLPHAFISPADAAGLTAPPIASADRIHWTVSGTIGAEVLGVGVLASTWLTIVDSPREWQRTSRGFEKRYAEREADVAISNTLEAGVGAIWGEDPRYIPSGRKGVWPRVRWAVETVVLAPRGDGKLAPAWGRYTGNIVNNVIENRWLPSSVTTWRQTTARSGEGLLSRLAGNLWSEFWPETRRLLRGRP